MTAKELIPFEATHPGILIKDELDARKSMTQKELAKEMGILATQLNEIIKGKRNLTVDNAIILEKIFEIPANFWMSFQTQYEIDKSRIKTRNVEQIKNLELWGIIKEYVPIKYFKKLRYITDNLADDILSIFNIYGVSSVEELIKSSKKLNHSLYRKSSKLQMDENNVQAWNKVALYEAKNQVVGQFNPDKLDDLCNDLNKVFYDNLDTIEKTKTVLNQYGIKFIIIPKFEKTPIDGYSFWSENNPAIALTLRHSRIDNFAFTVMHEVGHAILHLSKNHKLEFFDFRKNDIVDKAEQEADNFAQSKLISPKIWNDIIKNHFPLNKEKIESLSNQYLINSAIILGRAKFEVNKYNVSINIDMSLK